MSDDTEMRTSADIAREAEQRRADLGRTLDELRHKMTPGEIADDLWNLARGSGGGDFVRNLGRSMRDNPLPVTLIGAGVAWLMSGRGGAIRTDRRDSRDDYSFEDQQGRRRRLTAASAQQGLDDSFGTPYTEEDFYSSGESDAEGDRKRASWGFRRRAGEAAGEVRKAGEQLSEKASEAGRGISDAASQGTEAIGEAVSSAGHRIESLRRNASRRAARIGRGVYRSGTNAPGAARDFIEEQPLVAAALGLAFGAIIGAVVRRTETESELMGEASDRVKRQAAAMTKEGYEAAASVARRTLDEVRDEAQSQGFTTADAKDAAGDLRERVKAVYERGKEALEKEVDQTLEPASEDAANLEAQPSTGDNARDSLTPRPA